MTDTETTACACDAIVHPRILANPPGRELVDYRVGDYRSFRHALLRPRPEEVALVGWHPAAGDDLALQLLEWWAYLADVLVFYNERAFHEALLRTAGLPEDVRRIVRLLGYRPRPGIGATGVVAALTKSTTGFVVPRGFAIEGVPPLGVSAQIFEVDNDVVMGKLGQKLPFSARFPAPPIRPGAPPPTPVTTALGFLIDSVKTTTTGDKPHADGKPFTIALEGVVASVKPDDRLLLLPRDWNDLPGATYALSTVSAVVHTWDAAGRPITNVTMSAGRTLPDAVESARYRVLRATKLAHLWLYHERFPLSSDPLVVGPAITAGQYAQVAETIFDPLHLFSGGMASGPPQDPRPLGNFSFTDPLSGYAHLEAITRGINPGDPVLFEQRVPVPNGLPAPLVFPELTELVKVQGYAEDIWYANPPEADRVGQGPPVGPPSSRLLGGGAAAIPIPHTRITFAPLIHPLLDIMVAGGFGLKTIVMHYAWQEVAKIVDSPEVKPVDSATPDTSSDTPPGHPALLEDANGDGTLGFLGVPSTGLDKPLVPPVRALLNLLPVSRGETVEREILGSGDPILVRQEFALARAPLTYLTDAGPRAIDGYRSTLQIRVDGIEWTEVPSFYGQPHDARVFATREDDAQRTWVRFGDGENGARLPAGVDNVVARYRHGSGAATPRPGTLTSIVRPLAGLTEIRNPVSVGGGADPDPPDQIRRYAPRSVLTFGRAVSGDDYETVVAQTPGVARARAAWAWDAAAQRTLVKVYVGDDAAAVDAGRAALLGFADPNRPVVVEAAMPLFPDLTLTVEVHPSYDAADVGAAVTAALLDRATPPFGADVARIGDAIYDSEIYDACLRVPGVVAVHDLVLALWIRRRVTYFDPFGPFGIFGILGSFFDPLGIFGSLGPERLEPMTLRDLGDPLGTDSPFPPADRPPEAVVVPDDPLYDPFVPAGLPAPAHPPDPGTGAPPRPQFIDTLVAQTGERHSPGNGLFYLLRADRLHVRAEVARHVL